MRRLTIADWEALAILGAVSLGAAVRCWQIGYSFDSDEMFSVALASDSFAHTIARSLADTPHPPLHNILLHAWIWLFGGSEIAARSLSVLFSCGFIVLVYKLMRRYADAWSATGVALLAALSPLFVYYGQQARAYSLIALMSAANLYAFLKTLDAPHDKWPIRIWALTCIGLVYSQYIGVLFIGAQLAWVIAEKKEERWRLLFYGIAAMGTLGVWAFAAMGARALIGINPLPQINWIGAPAPQDFLWFYVAIFGAHFPTRWLFAIEAVLAVTYALAIYRTRWLPKEHRLLFALAFGLPLLAYAVSVWGPKPIFVARQLEGAALAVLLIVGLAAAEMPKWTARVALGALIVWSAMSARYALPDRINPPWRETAQWVEQHYGTRPLVAEERFCSEAMTYYSRGGPVRLWRDLDRTAQSGAFLFACRPAHCKKATETLAARASLVKTWHWHDDAGKTRFNQLMLYWVRAATPRDGLAIYGAATRR